MFLLSGLAYGQDSETDEFIRLYKQNYLEWITSPEIARLQARDPELKRIIDQIPIQQTAAFAKAAEKVRADSSKEFKLTDVLGDDAMNVSMDIIKELLAEENTEIIINLYWDVIRSAESKEIVDLIMPHVQKAKEDFERAGVDIANGVTN